MKRNILPIALLTVLPFSLPAQPQPRLQKLEEIATQLQLTPEQKMQLLPILAAEAPKVRAIKNDQSLSKQEKVQQLKALHDETNPQVKSILTPEQYEKLQEIRRTEILRVMRNRAGQ
jgi:protein CpxP